MLNYCHLFYSWDIEGAVYGTQCGEIESGSALVFLGDGERRVCTPYLDTTSYGNLRFHFTMGMDYSCEQSHFWLILMTVI